MMLLRWTLVFYHFHPSHSQGFTALDRIERSRRRRLADEDATSRVGLVDRPARRDVEIIAPSSRAPQ